MHANPPLKSIIWQVLTAWNLVISLHDIALNPMLTMLIQQTTNNVMMQPWLKYAQTVRVGHSRSNIASACGRGSGCRSLVKIRGLMLMQYFKNCTSLVSTSTALASVMRCTIFAWWMVTRDEGIPEFWPCIPSAVLCLQSSALSGGLNLHLPQKKLSDMRSIRTRQRFSLMVTSQSTDRDSLKWLRQRYAVYCFMAAYWEGRLLTRPTT